MQAKAGLALLGSLCLLLLAVPTHPAGAVLRPQSPFAEALRRDCPAKRLHYLNPGILIDGIAEFKGNLPPAVRSRMERIARRDRKKCEIGAACVNGAYIQAARRLGLLSRMAEAVCKMPYACRAPFDCQMDS